MRIDFAALAEGVTSNSRGLLAVVGLNQRLITVPSLPQIFQLFQVSIVTDEGADGTLDYEPERCSVAVDLRDPDGKQTFRMAQGVMTVDKQFPELPAYWNIITGIPVHATRYGRYVVVVELSQDEEIVDSVARSFYVIRQPQADSDRATSRSTAARKGAAPKKAAKAVRPNR